MDNFSRSQPFGTLLKRYRRAAGLTQAALAERAGYSTIYISKLEGGERVPLAVTVGLLADALALAPHERTTLEAAARHRSAARGTLHTASDVRPLAPDQLPPLVGRAPELALLRGHLSGEGPPLLLLAGEPGIGKSRLLVETSQRARTQGWTVLEGGCQRRSGQEPYAPLLAALKGRLDSQPAAQLQSELEGCAWLVRLLPEFAEVLPRPASSWTLPPEQERRLMFAAVARYLGNVSGPRGTLLVLDDLQWAGADALDLLSTLVPGAPAHRLRIVGAYRNTEVGPPDPLGRLVADFATGGLVAQQPLGPLPAQEMRVLLDHLLEGWEDTDRMLYERLVARTGGVPFFLVSCAQALCARPAAHREEAVPWTVAQSIRYRVTVLPVAAQDLLGVAAIIGRRMERSVLLAVGAQLGQNERATVVALEAASQAGLLLEAGEDTYQFPHDLIREVLVADLSAARRANLHRYVAEVLEQDPGVPAIERLAYHYQRAGVWEKAVLYLKQAGDRAHARYAHAEAERCFRDLAEGLHRLGRLAEEGQTLEKLGEILGTVGRYDQALEALERAVDLAQASGDVEGLRRALGRLAEVYGSRGMPEEGLARLHPLLSAIEASEPSPSLAVVFWQLAWLSFGNDQPREALAAADRSAQVARVLGDEAQLARAEYWRGCALRELGRMEESWRAMEEAIPRAEASGDIAVLSGARRSLGARSLNLGEFETSRGYLEQAVEHAQQWGDLAYTISVTCQRGHLAFLQGDWNRARADYERAEAVVRQVGLSWAWAVPPFYLGQLCLAEGQWDEASRALEDTLTRAEQMKDTWCWWNVPVLLAERELLDDQVQVVFARLEPLLQRFDSQAGALPPEFQLVLAWAALERGDQAQAEARLEESQSRAQREHNRLLLGDVLRIQALLRLRQERWSEAQEALEEALRLARAMPYPYAEAKALFVSGQVHVQHGESEQAHKRWEEALAICARLGERLYAERIEAALAQLEG